MPIDESRAFIPLRLAALTISDTRDADSDRSGKQLAELIAAAGHQLAHQQIVPDDCDTIVAALTALVDDPHIDCVLTTGGTGVTGRDVTPEALDRLGGKDIPGFGELFRWLSYASIGTSTIQSRACARAVGGTYIFALPGSPGAVRDGWDGILKYQLDSRHRPCNFAELLPRLTER